MDMDGSQKDPIALHVIVVGFHHKKGMQIEFAYPPFNCGENEFELPEKWKHIPSLCLPDGAHNHEADTIYFHLPHLTLENQTVFGVSCYRQINAEKVANKTADITRNTVQKSVCVLTTLPIYGYVQERLRVTTKVYFKEADFSDVRDLEGLYHDMNNTNWKDKLMHGICATESVRVFGRNILVIFKLLLLERRILFYHSPVGPLVRTITSLMALMPALLPEGLSQAASVKYYRNNDIFERDVSGTTCCDHRNERKKSNICDDIIVDVHKPTKENVDSCTAGSTAGSTTNESVELNEETDANCDLAKDFGSKEEELGLGSPLDDLRSSVSSLTSVSSRGSVLSSIETNHHAVDSQSAPNLTSKIYSIKGRLSGAINYWTGREKNIQEKPSVTATPNPSPSEPGDDTPLSPTCGMPLLSSDNAQIDPVENSLPNSDASHNNLAHEKYANLYSSECGLPLNIFTKGNLVHPYLSLQYLEVLNASTTRAFVAGVSNTLFLHKKNLYDVLIHIEDGRIEVFDPDLKKQLALSTEDLRFADNIVKQVQAVLPSPTTPQSPSAIAPHSPSRMMSFQQNDVYQEGVGWLGGEEWLRHQFKVYLLSLMRSSMCDELSRECEVFVPSFLNAWKSTHNYRMWVAGGPYLPLEELEPGHPNSGNLSMTDMKIRLAHTFQGLDRGRKINQTLANTGTAVVKTKEAVGGALSSAKVSLTNFWSSFSTAIVPPEGIVDEHLAEQAVEATEMEVCNSSASVPKADDSDLVPVSTSSAECSK